MSDAKPTPEMEDRTIPEDLARRTITIVRNKYAAERRVRNAARDSLLAEVQLVNAALERLCQELCNEKTDGFLPLGYRTIRGGSYDKSTYVLVLTDPPQDLLAMTPTVTLNGGQLQAARNITISRANQQDVYWPLSSLPTLLAEVLYLALKPYFEEE